MNRRGTRPLHLLGELNRMSVTGPGYLRYFGNSGMHLYAHYDAEYDGAKVGDQLRGPGW